MKKINIALLICTVVLFLICAFQQLEIVLIADEVSSLHDRANATEEFIEEQKATNEKDSKAINGIFDSLNSAYDIINDILDII